MPFGRSDRSTPAAASQQASEQMATAMRAMPPFVIAEPGNGRPRSLLARASPVKPNVPLRRDSGRSRSLAVRDVSVRGPTSKRITDRRPRITNHVSRTGVRLTDRRLSRITNHGLAPVPDPKDRRLSRIKASGPGVCPESRTGPESRITDRRLSRTRRTIADRRLSRTRTRSRLSCPGQSRGTTACPEARNPVCPAARRLPRCGTPACRRCLTQCPRCTLARHLHGRRPRGAH